MLKQIYLCEDCVDGIFTAIYKAWEAGTSKTDVRVFKTETMSLFEEYIEIETDPELARKVASSINSKLSYEVYHYAYFAALSNDPNKASYIYKYLQKAFRIGIGIVNYLQDSDVMRVFELTRLVEHEVGYYREFIRFEELQNSILAGKISPKYDIAYLLAPHFADRFHCENWIILDTVRNHAVIHKAHKGYIFADNISEADLDNFADISDKEAHFQALWKRFFDTIAIEERINPKLQRNNMPLRFRKYMTAENAPRGNNAN